MKRPWHIWALFAVCVVVALAALSWISATALGLDRAERNARRRAELEESVRLALWRMDSALSPLIAQESARPYFAYTPFYPVQRAYTSMFAQISEGEVLTPSPLLIQVSPRILLHFQFGPDGAVTSPQVPVANMRDLAETGYATHEKILEAEERLHEFEAQVSREALLRALGREPTQVGAVFAPAGRRGELIALVLAAAVVQAEAEPEPPEQQLRRSIEEWRARQESVDDVRHKKDAELRPAAPGVSEGALEPVWVGDLLLLARCTRVNGGDYVQGCWLDWPGIRASLLREVADLLPEADLIPVTDDAAGERSRRLAALPVQLLPGVIPATAADGLSPLGLALAIAWACVILAAVAAAVLLRGAVALSERRGAFVSAVTHEMRTPLTTFRMYAEMLAEGMVPAEKRGDYLDTLQREADRLGHLVENVLAYAQLERGSARSRVETVSVGELLDRVQGCLARRAEQAEMTLIVEDNGCRDVRLRTDPAAAEQILFNLVDNACKYAPDAEDRRVHVEVGNRPGEVVFRVRDHGPGVPAEDRARLFRPFCKSARDAAGSAPGVGLGLALSRGLARRVGGDLRLDPAAADGAAFSLTFPAAR